jgi:predicted branched-subunit amino acid permease
MSVALTRVCAVSTSARSATLRDAIGLGAAVGLYGVAFGAAAAGAGLSTWQALAMSALMFTGASQFAFVGVLSAGGGAAAAVGSALLLGTRNTVYGVRLTPLLAPRGWARRAGASHWVIDETTAMAVAAPDRELGRLAFWATGATIYLGWNVTTVIGSLGAAGLGETAQAALDSVVPAAFLALLWPRLTGSAPEPAVQRRVALGGAVVALVLTPFVPAGVQVILAVVAVALAGPPRRDRAEDNA